MTSRGRFRIVITGDVPYEFLEDIFRNATRMTPEDGGVTIQIGEAVDDEGKR